ncbi:MAG: hypothetical protein M1827_001946 [Pycnora praestabilis]|nr:MAG: hypothetical protein M1827_001946 [Pycnora praestabilis]
MVQRPNIPSAIPVSPIAPSPKVDISKDNSRITATLPTGDSVEILLFGATIISWKSSGKENLFLSSKAHLDGSKAVRGGIPLVFPVFGPPPSNSPTSKLPQHGFARTSRWEYLGKSTSESGARPNSTGDDSVKLDFGLSSSNLSPETRKAWPYDFGLIYSVTLGRNGLGTTLNVRNEGEEAFEFQVLLHSYLRVNDIRKITISGLDNTEFIDKVRAASKHSETHSALPISSETDRVYSVDAEAPITVSEAGKSRFAIERDNLNNVVVWNPWEGAAKINDFEPADGWKNMICVEAGAVSGWQKLDAGDTFEGGQTIKSLL